MTEQPNQNRVWDFATEAYLPSEDDEQATGKSLILGATGARKTTSLNAHLNAEATRPDAGPVADSESAQ
jgi:hypothetical protein